MKALWISERFWPQRGGVARAATRQVRALAPHLERIDVVCLSADQPPGWVDATELAPGATVHRIGRASEDDDSRHLLLLAALRLLESHEHHLVHGFYATFAGAIATLVARHQGLPSIVSLRGNDVHRGLFRPSRAGFLHDAVNAATAVTSVSRELLDLVRAATARTEELHRIPNGVDPSVFTPGAPEPSHLVHLERLPRPWIGFVGEARFKKGLGVLQALAARLDQGTVVLVGGVRRDERETVERWRAQHPKAASRLVELPYTRETSELVSLYRALDVLVLPSLWDGLPNSLLEAMACAATTVATRTGGLRETIHDGATGVLVEPGDIDGLCTAVHAVLEAPAAWRRQVGDAARRWVCDNATEDHERDRLLELYRRLV